MDFLSDTPESRALHPFRAFDFRLPQFAIILSKSKIPNPPVYFCPMFHPLKISPRRLLIAALFLLIFSAIAWFILLPTSAGPAEGTNLLGSLTAHPASPSLRIATFNIDGGVGADSRLDLDRTSRCLQRIDFIALNEVHGNLFGQPHNQAEDLAEIWHLPYLYVPAERRLGHDTFGNAIFTDLPVEHWSRVVLPSRLLKARRNYLLTDVRWHDKTLHIITTHTDWKTGGEEQLQIVSDLFQSLPEPAILMGDLNSTSAHSLQIQQLLSNPHVEEAIISFLGPQPPGRVDWIFLRGLTATDAGVVDISASDHPAYWAQVELKKDPTTKSAKP